MTPPDPPAVFEEPWQAQAFALTLHLHAVGAFTWSQWAVALADAERGNETTDETSYYEHWLTALETLAAQLGLADAHSMAARKADWALAFERTPHGQPVELSPP